MIKVTDSCKISIIDEKICCSDCGDCLELVSYVIPAYCPTCAVYCGSSGDKSDGLIIVKMLIRREREHNFLSNAFIHWRG